MDSLRRAGNVLLLSERNKRRRLPLLFNLILQKLIITTKTRIRTVLTLAAVATAILAGPAPAGLVDGRLAILTSGTFASNNPATVETGHTIFLLDGNAVVANDYEDNVDEEPCIEGDMDGDCIVNLSDRFAGRLSSPTGVLLSKPSTI